MSNECEILYIIEKSGFFIDCNRCAPDDTTVAFTVSAPISGTVEVKILSYDSFKFWLPQSAISGLFIGVDKKPIKSETHDLVFEIQAGVQIVVQLLIPKRLHTESVSFRFKKLEGEKRGAGGSPPETERSEGSDAPLT